MTLPSDGLGIRKTGRFKHIIRLLEERGIKYDRNEIANLSTRQMTKKIKELGDWRKTGPKENVRSYRK